MAERLAGVSPPPSPPDDYRGPAVDLVDRNGGRVARLRIVDDAVAVHLDGHHGVFHDTTTIRQFVCAVIEPSAVRAVVRERPWATRREHAVLLLFVASLWPEIHLCGGGMYHLTLAYALPLALDRKWRRWAEGNADRLVGAQQLVAVPADDFVVVDPGLDLRHRHRRLLRHHRHTVVDEHNDVRGFMDDWSRFSRWRYGREVPSDECDVVHEVLTFSRCTVRDFIHRDALIARSVVCRHVQGNVWFDIMATWDAGFARLRPGIYSGVHNILAAGRSGARYSLCYGRFAYKDDVVGASTRLTVHDLIVPAQ